jgi:hypothetical protein
MRDLRSRVDRGADRFELAGAIGGDDRIRFLAHRRVDAGQGGEKE